MSPSQKALPSSESGKTEKQLKESLLRIVQATATLFNKLLSDDALRIWRDLLNYCSETEATEAFKKWQYEGTYFPTPAEILQLVANERDTIRQKQEGCSRECQSRHGRGYGDIDMRWLFKKFLAARESDPKVRVLSLLDELDAKRGKSPEWRTQTEMPS